MATLTEQLDALIAEHGLACITISRFPRAYGSGFWSVNAQAETPTGREIGSNSLNGETPSECLAAAINDLNAKRVRAVSVPELEAA
jgi:hypothetical protein